MSSFSHLVVSQEVISICQRPVFWLDDFRGRITAQCSCQIAASVDTAAYFKAR